MQEMFPKGEALMYGKKLVVATSPDLLRKLKVYVAQHDTTIHAFVNAVLEQSLQAKEVAKK